MSANPFDNNSVSHDAVEQIMTSNGVVLAKKNNIGKLKARMALQTIQSQGSTSNVFTNGSNTIISYLLPNGVSNQIDIVRDLVFEFTVTNNDGTGKALTLLPCGYWLNLVSIETGGSVVENCYPDQFLIDATYLQENDEKILAHQTLENFTYSSSGYTTNTTNTIADGVSKTFYFTLNCCLNRAQLFLSAITSQITIQLQFNAKAYTSTSLSTAVSMSNSKLVMSGYRYDEAIRNKLLQRYASSVTSSIYQICQREIIPGVSLSTASTSYIQVTSFSGMNISMLCCGARPNGAAQENLYTFDQFAQIDLKNSGTSVFMNSLNYREYSIMNMEVFPSSAGYAENMMVLPFSIDAYDSVKSGLLRGSLVFSPNFTLEILNGATATRELVLLAYQFNKFSISGGRLIREAL